MELPSIEYILRRETMIIKRIRVILLLLICLVLVTIIQLLVNPMRRPVSSARNHLLRHTPIGTDMQDVIAFIDSRSDWEIGFICHERGFRHPNPGFIPGQFTDEELRNPIVIGNQSIRVFAGRYLAWYKLMFLVPTDVSIFWGFDEDGKLIEIHVWKTYDIP